MNKEKNVLMLAGDGVGPEVCNEGKKVINAIKERFNFIVNIEDELIGALIVEKALSAPLKKIASNAGQNGSVVLERVKEADFEVGYNAATNEFCNMFDIGIIDPAKVTRSTLQNAASIASMVLTTECIIVDKSTESTSTVY